MIANQAVLVTRFQNSYLKEIVLEGRIKVTRQNSLLLLQICRPEKKNAMTQKMYSELSDGLKMGDEDSEIKVIILHGMDGLFTSGNDLKGFKDGPSKDGNYPHNNFLDTLINTEKPVIAAVSGFALGIGTIMLFHCDLVYAAPDTKFSLPFINLGLSPEGATSYILPHLIGYQRAAELMMFGDKFSVDTAQQIGLVNDVVLNDALMGKAVERAEKLASLPQGAILKIKSMLKKSVKDAVSEARDYELKVFNERLQTDEVRNAISNFYNKRN